MQSSPAFDKHNCTISTTAATGPRRTTETAGKQEQQGGNHTKNSSSSGTSYLQRDSRFQSIYDRYLYPREGHQAGAPSLDRKGSSRKAKRLDSIKEMSSPSKSASAQAAAAFKKKRQSSVIFAPGTKGDKGQRESQAWAGMMMNNVDSDESDSDESDDGRRAQIPAPASGQRQMTNTGGNQRGSWSSRAAAVGSRPPDSASQNPPTLKLLGLRSVKEGGAPIGDNGSGGQSGGRYLQAEQQSRERTPSPAFDMVADQPGQRGVARERTNSTSDYGDEVDRHGSYIDFGGADGFSGGPLRGSRGGSRGFQLEDGPVPPVSSSLVPPRSPHADQPLSPRTALTHQLGLITPQQPPPAQGQRGEADGYFSAAVPPSGAHSPTRNLIPSNSPQRQYQPQQGQMPPRMMNAPPAQSIPLQRGPPSPRYPSPQLQGQHPPSMRSGPGPAPMPIALPSPVRPSAGGMMTSVPPPYSGGPRPSLDSRNGPSPGPGFSDSPQVGGRGGPMKRQPSMLRRSMAFITGNNDGQQGMQSQPMPRAGGANNQQQRGSLFRRSMAFITGRPPMPATQEQEVASSLGDEDDVNAPQPRVNGFMDEKPKNRKSEYLGASGMGDEWDYSGYGAKFWKRFSVAQRREMEGANKDSEAFRLKTERRRKWIMCMSLFGGVIIIAGVVAIVIWRESVTTSDIPGAVDRQRNGVNPEATPSGGVNVNGEMASGGAATSTGYTPQTDYGSSEARSVTSTTRRKHRTKNNNNNRREAMPTSGTDEIRRLIEQSSDFQNGIHPLPRRDFDGQLVRRRKHTGHANDLLATPAPRPQAAAA